MKMVAPIASSAGMGFEDVTAAIALMGNAGIQGTMAGTSLRFAIGSLLDPVDDVAKELKRLGITTKDAEGNLLPFLEIVEQLENSGANTSSMLKIFGQRAGAGMSAIIGQGTEALRSMQQSLIDAGGTAKHVADTQMKGLAGEMKEFTSAMESAKIEMGGELLPILTELMNDHITPLIQKFSALDEETKKFIIFGMIIAAAVAPLMMIIGMMMPLLAFLLANPVGLLLIGVAVAIGLIYWALKDWEGMQRTLNELWEKFGEIVERIFGQEVWDNFSQIVEGVVGGIVSLIQGVWAALQGDHETSKEKFKEMWGHFGDAALGVLDSIWEAFKFLVDRMGILILGEERWEKFKDIFIPIFDGIGDYFKTVIESFVGMWKGICKTIKGLYQGDMYLMTEGVKQMANAVGNHLNWFIRQINKVMPDRWDLPEFKPFDTMAMKAERALRAKVRQEDQYFGEADRRWTRNYNRPVPEGYGSGGFNVTVQMVGDTYGMDDFEAKVAQAVNEGVQRGGFQGVIE